MADVAPPHDLEAERAVLGACLLDGEAVATAAAALDAADFYHPAHAATFDALVAVSRRSEPVDVVTLASELRASGRLAAVGGAQALGELTDGVSTVAHVANHARIVREHAEVRRACDAARELIAAAYAGARRDAVCESVQRLALSLSERAGESAPEHIGDLLQRAFARLEERAAGVPAPGLRTGYANVDALLNPMRGGHLILVAGRPSMGKTSFVTQVAANVAASGSGVLFFSLETKNDDLTDRSLCAKAAVDVARLQRTAPTQSEMNRLVSSAKDLYQLPLWFDDGYELTVSTLRRKATRHKLRHGLGLLVVDHVGLMRPDRPSDSRVNDVSQISRGLKALAKELDVPIIALSQLNRSSEGRTVKDHRPKPSDLRDSGALEQDADVVAFVYRDVVYNPSADPLDAELIVAKQKNGPTDTARLKFLRHATRFEDAPDERAAQSNDWSDAEQRDHAAE